VTPTNQLVISAVHYGHTVWTVFGQFWVSCAGIATAGPCQRSIKTPTCARPRAALINKTAFTIAVLSQWTSIVGDLLHMAFPNMDSTRQLTMALAYSCKHLLHFNKLTLFPVMIHFRYIKCGSLFPLYFTA